jgi:IclR family transcriptional regulator, KDG regulon repressor
MEENTLRYKTLSDFSRILGLFEEPDVEERGVSDIAKSLDMLPSKVSRMLKTLEADSWVEKNPHSGKYRIGVRFLQVGLLYVLNHPLRRLVLPHLEQMARDLGLLSGWGIFKNGKIIVVDRIRMKKGPLIHLLGSDVPIHSSSYGKLFLAFMKETEREPILRSLAFLPTTASTIRDVESMKEEITRVKEQGFAVDSEESSDGIMGIAAPVLDDKGDMVAAITVSGESAAFTPDRTSETEYLREKALFISRQLGYRAAG